MLTSVDSEQREERLQRVKELEEFTQNCRRKVEEIFTELKWNQRETECGGDAEEELVQCPFDPGHTVPLGRLQRHRDTCLLKKMEYSSEEQEQMPDSSFCYKNTNVKTFIMDKDTQQQVIGQARAAAPLMKMEGIFWQGHYSSKPAEVPQNHKRALCDLTVADRLALYDHVTRELSNQKDPAPSCSNEDLYVDLVKKLQKEEGQKEPKTQLELMAEMRDYKRRRQSYRAKNVHITKKSYTEVIREVINVHSEELSRQWREEEREEGEEREEAGAERRRHRERSHERQRDGESKKKKKKRQRDSRSPDDHRERKKKKKKRKREECEEREDE